MQWAQEQQRPDPDGKPWPNRRGLMNFVATQERGRWSIAAFHNQDLPTAERAKAADRLWPKVVG